MGKSTQFRWAGHIGRDDEPTQKIRCPIHGFIHYSANERKIIDHPIFRRLRYIRQLALTDYVYPGATHTRFEHSLGVTELATRAFESLCARHGATIEEHFRAVPYFREKPLPRARQILRLAALLHDCGHAPFSHAAESVIHAEGRHEALTRKIIASDKLQGGCPGLRPLLDGMWGAGTAQTLDSLLNEQGPPPPLKLLKELISGEIDADRTDYLLRDSLHCGVDYGRFDYRRMIECLAIRMDEAGIPEVALQESGLQTYEALLLARYQMNTQVYYHGVRRIYDHYLKCYHEAIAPVVFKGDSSILKENDFTMLTRIQSDAEKSNAPGHAWAKRIAERRQHAEVFSLGILVWNEEGAHAQRRLEKLFQKLNSNSSEADLILDLCEKDSPISLHKLPQRLDDPSDQSLRSVKLIKKDGTETELGFASPILGVVPRQFKLPRIYADRKGSELDKKALARFTQRELDGLNAARQKVRKVTQEKARKLWAPLGG